MSQVKVSVVVAVYNTGTDLLRLVRSLDVQSLPHEEFEVLFVDDGSTDDTPALLREVVDQRPNTFVHTIENSGWPGRPRNVGLDNARGEYVFFSDHDDEFFPHALERMHELAHTNRSDIVYGKIVRSGRTTPYWPLAAADVPRADVRAEILLSRTVHKLFRREFLNEHSIRFLEGRVRLEDHHFMAQALPRARVVSVLASEPCYRWVHRRDGSNASDQRVDPATYWPWYIRQLEVFRDVAGPGPLLDDARVAVVTQAFSRFAPRAYLKRGDSQRQALFDAVRPLAQHVPRELDARLPTLKRLRVQAIRDGDRRRFDALQTYRTTISFDQRLTDLHWQGGHLVVSARAKLVRDGRRPMRLEHADGVLRLPLPHSLATDDESRRLLDTETGTLEVTIRHAGSGIEWPLRCEQRARVEFDHDTATTFVDCTAIIAPETAAFGSALSPGVWDLLVRVQFLGESLVSRVKLPPDMSLPKGRDAPSGWRIYATEAHDLRLQVQPQAFGQPVAQAVRWDGEQLAVTLSSQPPAGSVLIARHRGGDSETLPCAAVRVRDTTTTIALPVTEPGQIVDLSVAVPAGGDLRVAFTGPVDRSRWPLSVYSTVNHALSIKHESARIAAVSSTAGWRRAVRRLRRWRRGGIA